MKDFFGFFDGVFVGRDEEGNEIYDREYNAEDLSNVLGAFFKDGIFPKPSTGLLVESVDDFQVKVHPGQAFINKRFYWLQEAIYLRLEDSDINFNRIDRIVIQFDNDKREIGLKVKPGIPASAAKAPDLIRDSSIYELSLAEVTIRSKSNTIAERDVKDTRFDESLCGIVAAAIDELDVNDIRIKYFKILNDLVVQFDNENKYNSQSFKNFIDKETDVILGFIQELNRLIEAENAAGEIIKLIEMNRQEINDSIQSLLNIQDQIIDDLENIDKKMDSHINSKIYKNEVHGIKFNAKGKLEVYNGKEWIELKGGGLPVNITRNVEVFKEDDKRIELRWEDPEDVIVDGETVAKWKSTKIVRKQGSMLKNDEDGVLVGQSSVRNQYKDNSFIDTQGLENGKVYFYGVFPESEDEIVTISNRNIITATPRARWLYGFKVDERNLNPSTAITYINENTEFTPAEVVDNKINWGSWENFIKDISYRVLVKDGVEQYQVQYDDPTKRLDGSPADLTGADGDLFTRFIHIYRKYTSTYRGYQIELSNEPFEGAKSLTKELEDGYNQFNNPIMILLQDLYLLLFKNRDSQSALGKGYVNGDYDFTRSGGTNGKGYIYGDDVGEQQMCFLGIEDLYGNKYQRVDGIVSDESYNIKVATKSFNDGGIGYTTIKTSQGFTSGGFTKHVIGGDCGYVIEYGPTASSSTGYCDYSSVRTESIAYMGGARRSPESSGIFCIDVFDSAGQTRQWIGGRLCYKNTAGVYVGNYLGYIEEDKLRSISGKIPTGNYTIGELRTLAQNNN